MAMTEQHVTAINVAVHIEVIDDRHAQVSFNVTPIRGNTIDPHTVITTGATTPARDRPSLVYFITAASEPQHFTLHNGKVEKRRRKLIGEESIHEIFDNLRLWLVHSPIYLSLFIPGQYVTTTLVKNMFIDFGTEPKKLTSLSRALGGNFAKVNSPRGRQAILWKIPHIVWDDSTHPTPVHDDDLSLSEQQLT